MFLCGWHNSDIPFQTSLTKTAFKVDRSISIDLLSALCLKDRGCISFDCLGLRRYQAPGPMVTVRNALSDLIEGNPDDPWSLFILSHLCENKRKMGPGEAVSIDTYFASKARMRMRNQTRVMGRTSEKRRRD